MNRFKELKVWQKSIELVIEVYKLTNKFPKEEKFGLISQINRAAVSIPSNIAEGAGRNSNKEFSRFLSIAMGSCFELDTQFIISEKLNFINSEEIKILQNEISYIQNMIFKLKNSLEKNT